MSQSMLLPIPTLYSKYIPIWSWLGQNFQYIGPAWETRIRIVRVSMSGSLKHEYQAISCDVYWAMFLHILSLRQFIFNLLHNVFWSIEPANALGCLGETARYPLCWRSLSASFSTAAFRAEHLQFSLEATKTKRLTSNGNWIHQSRIQCREKESWIGVNWAPNLWTWCASNAPTLGESHCKLVKTDGLIARLQIPKYFQKNAHLVY